MTYAYDADSRVTNRSISGGTTETYGYTNAELTNVANNLGSFTYTYDSASARLVNVAYPNSQSVTYGYYSTSGSGRLQTITNKASGGSTLSYFNYTYDDAGEITQWIKQLGVSTSSAVTNNFGYDNDSELQAVTQTFASGATSQTSSFNYDVAGNRTLEQLTIGSSGSPQAGSFTHNFGTPNNLNQLTGETISPLIVKGSTSSAATLTVNGASVTEDANNNFNTTLTPLGGSSTPLTIQATGANGATSVQKNHVLNTEPFVYDRNGNLVKDSEKTYTWDAANRLISVAYINPQPATIADNVTFQYDGLGRRTAITEKHGNTVLNSGANDWRFVWCGKRLCEQRDSTGTNVIKRFFNRGEYIVSGSTKYFYTFDHLGSAREMVDSSGVTVQAQYDYDSYGRQTQIAGTQKASFGYTKFFIEPATNLNLTWFRAYDSEKGRWLSRELLENMNPRIITGPNLYAYVWNYPISLVDHTGLFAAGAGLGVEGMGSYGGAGAGGTASVGGGFFWGPGWQYNGTGDYGSAGGFAGMPTNGGGVGMGVAGSAGPNFWFSPQAHSMCDLNGPFQTLNIYLPMITLTMSSGTGCNGQPIDVYGFGVGPFGGAGFSYYPTTTQGGMD